MPGIKVIQSRDAGGFLTLPVLQADDCPPAGLLPARGRVFGVFERCGCFDEDALFGAFMVQTVSSQMRRLLQN